MKITRRLQVGAGAAALTCSLAVGTIALSPTAIANFGAVTAITSVNIRTSPSTGAGVLGVLHRGEKLTQVGAIKGGWVPVRFGSKTAYISANYLTGARSSADSTAAAAGDKGDAWATEPLNVRSGPAVRFSKLGLLAKGTKVERTGLVSNGFTQIFYSTGRAWVSTDYLSSKTPSTTKINTSGSVRAASALLVRDQSRRGIAGYTDIPKDTILPTTGARAPWVVEVVWRGERVWVSSSYVHPVGQVPTAEPEALPSEIGTRYATELLNVRSGPGTSYSLVTTVPAGTALRITGTVKNGFAQVNFNGAARWVSAGYLSTTPDGPADNPGSGGSGGSGGTTPPPAGPINLKGSVGLAGLEPNARNIVNVIASRYGLTTFYGVRPDALPDHPSGHAVDVMLPDWRTSAGKARGWEVANYLRANAKSLGVQYVIFDQKIWNISRDSEGWRAMADRGGATANHMDHVHVTTVGL